MITIPFEILSMKNSKMIRTKITGPGKKTKFIASRPIVIQQKIDIVKHMLSIRKEWDKEIEGKTKPYILCYKLYRKTERAFDYNNITQIVFDAMEIPKRGKVGAGWIEDDDMRHLMPIACGWEKDDKNPRMEFFIANEEQKKVLEKEIFYLHNKNESDIV